MHRRRTALVRQHRRWLKMSWLAVDINKPTSGTTVRYSGRQQRSSKTARHSPFLLMILLAEKMKSRLFNVNEGCSQAELQTRQRRIEREREKIARRRTARSSTSVGKNSSALHDAATWRLLSPRQRVDGTSYRVMCVSDMTRHRPRAGASATSPVRAARPNRGPRLQ